MEQELRYILTIIGAIVIGGVLIHGIWTVRKNSSKNNKRAKFEASSFEPRFERDDGPDEDTPIYDDVGIGKVRIVNETLNPVNDATFKEEVLEDNEIASDEVKVIEEVKPIDTLHVSAIDAEPKQEETEVSINETDIRIDVDEETVTTPVYSNVVTQPKPEYTKAANTRVETHKDKVEDFGQPPEFLLKKKEEPSQLAKEEQPSLATEDDQVVARPVQKIDASKDTPTHDSAIDNSSEPPSVIQDEPQEPTFSLNIQEGPLDKHSDQQNAEIKPDSDSAHTLEKSNDEKIKNTALKKGVEKEMSFAEQAKRFVRRNKKTVAEKIRREPSPKHKVADDQMRIDFDSDNIGRIGDFDEPSIDSAKKQDERPSDKSTESPSQETDVLVLNVRAENDNPISGAALLPMLLTLGFKFGEHDIFHRHVNTNGKGPVLFSLTNMFKPGIFDVDNMENFDTFGVSLFMMLPIDGDAQQVFNMMHNAARKISEEFGCRILDGNKVGLSKQSLQQYVERIREFERKRIGR